MPHQIVITDEDVEHAGNILLSQGDTFDSERASFIKNFETIDLQACPGSGKTTCLLAKLLILGRYLPKIDQGVLVLSHTNAAIDEIKDKIFKYFPELFQYPNFVGTIQSFVDYFLAIPFYTQKYGYQPNRIDDEIFNEKVWEPREAKAWLNQQADKTEFLRSLRFDNNGDLVTGVDGLASKFRLTNKTSATYKALLGMRKKLMAEGYLCFDDGYYLGESYLGSYPPIADLIRLRFGFVFIDEMQDTDVHQMSILDKIFPSGCSSVVQRIGDQNQAIYGRRVKSDVVWSPRPGGLSLNGSKRLSEYIANTVKNISVCPQELVGNSRRVNIKPKILLFDDASIKKVIPKFAEIIVENNLHQKEHPVFKAIGWRKSISDNGGRGIESYFDNFFSIPQKNKIDYDYLEDYLNSSQKDVESKGICTFRQNLLNSIIKTLRISGIKNTDNKPFTSQSLITFLREGQPDEYEILKQNLFTLSLNNCNGLDIKDDLITYARHLLENTFSIVELNRETELFLTGSRIQEPEITSAIDSSTFRDKFCHKVGEVEVRIEVVTIHSVKGETHTATLYLETYYFNDSGKSYESQRLLEQLKGNRPVGKAGKRVQESQKMAYVGMTRPTDLLCLAINKSSIPPDEVNNLKTKWDVIDLTA